MKQRLEQWLLMLNSREKIMVFGGLALAVLILLWAGVWEPLAARKVQLEKQLQNRENELRWMQNAQRKIVHARSQPQRVQHKKISNPSQVIETALQRYQLKKSLKQMRGNKEVSISLKEVNADKVFQFLGELETRYGLQIITMNINPLEKDKSKSKGKVNATIKLASSK